MLLSPNFVAYPESMQFRDGRFENPVAIRAVPASRTLPVLWDIFFNKPQDAIPKTSIPLQQITQEQLAAAPDRSAFRLGHSTLLLKLQGTYWLTDPVFSERAFPLQFAGPKRFHPSPISLDAVPPIQGVLISHDHYDHLDREAILALSGRTAVFVTPLGVGDRLIQWGVPEQKVRQLDWWQSTEVNGVRLTATPAQHFSGRALIDTNRTLWASWVIDDGGFRMFFSGDGGYFDGFKEIGRKFGPFNVTFMETGAYDAQWASVHMTPEQSVQAHRDLGGVTMVPIHNGTFDLAMHNWYEPLARVTEVATEKGIRLSTPVIGELLDLQSPGFGSAWWHPGFSLQEREDDSK